METIVLNTSQKLERLRNQAAMAGIVALSEHVPRHIPLDDRPTPATDYLYESIIIASFQKTDGAIRGLRDFFKFLISEVLENRVISNNPTEFVTDALLLRKMRSEFHKKRPNLMSLQGLTDQWVSSVRGVTDDHYLYYETRREVTKWGSSFVRVGVVKTVHTLQSLENGDFDWWHHLGKTVLYFAHGYMAQEWGQLPELPFFYIEESEDAKVEIAVGRASYLAMRWRYQESLFMTLADCIGHRCGRLPKVNQELSYPRSLIN